MTYKIVLLTYLSLNLFGCQQSSVPDNKTGDSLLQVKPDTGKIPSAAGSKAKIDSNNTVANQPEPNWQVAGIDDPAGFKIFFSNFKTWLEKDEQDSITAHIAFPIKKYKTPQSFRNNFSKVFNAQFKKIISEQSAGNVFVNAQGVMLGNGEIWINYLKGNYYITAINAAIGD